MEKIRTIIEHCYIWNHTKKKEKRTFQRRGRKNENRIATQSSLIKKIRTVTRINQRDMVWVPFTCS